MTPTPSVCVIGAGASGLATAVQLTRRGVEDVTVVEAEHPAAGSSGLSVGVIETQYVEPLDIELRVRSMAFFADLERNHGLDVKRIGYLRLAHTAGEAGRFATSVGHQHELGVTDAAVIDAERIAELIPELRVDDVEAGLWGPSDGFIDGHLYCALLAELAIGRGARVLSNTRVTGASRDGARHVIATSRGDVTADVVVNAAGPWAQRVAALLETEMPLVPQRHQAVVVHLARELDYEMPMVMDYTPHSGETGLYFRHERPGQLIAGLHSEEAVEAVGDPDSYARSADPDFVEGVAMHLASRVPAFIDAGLAHGWAGLYPVSPDGLPQAGPARGDDTVICAGGAGGSGIQLSPVVGELAADWIAYGGPRSFDSGELLSPRRESLSAAAPILDSQPSQRLR